MVYKIAWSTSALDDVEAIADYVSRDSKSYASAVVRKIIHSTRSLERFPFAGRIVPEFDHEMIRKSLRIAIELFIAWKTTL